MGVSSDSVHNRHQLVFKTDSTLEITAILGHLSPLFTVNLHYKRNGNEIKLLDNTFSQRDSQSLISYRLPQFLHATTFTVDQRAIVDTASNMVYVRYADFRKKYYLTYLIDGKVYQQETRLADNSGVIQNNPAENSAIKEKLASLDLDHYQVDIYKGLAAYKKFGYNYVFGVIVLQRKK
jgi:hypothetical protein